MSGNDLIILQHRVADHLRGDHHRPVMNRQGSMLLCFFPGDDADVGRVQGTGVIDLRGFFHAYNTARPVNLLHAIPVLLMKENRAQIRFPKHLVLVYCL